MNTINSKRRKFITRIAKSVIAIDHEIPLINNWKESKTGDAMWNKEAADVFFLHSGPTYANAQPHLGTLYNLTLKDAIIKMYNLLGFKSAFIHGVDTHGLPILNRVIKERFPNNLPSDEILWQTCKEFALHHTQGLISNINRMGILLHTTFYKTLDNNFELAQLLVFKDLVDKKYIKYRLMPTFKCLSCQTALSFSDVTKCDKKVPYLYFLSSTNKENHFLVCWTTSIYSFEFNQAVAINSKIIYHIGQDSLQRKIIASKDFFERENIKSKIIANDELLKLQYYNFQQELCSIFDSDTVTEDMGTGIVHLSSECSQDDYRTLSKFNIKPRYSTFIDGNFKDVQAIADRVLSRLYELGLVYRYGMMDKMVTICVRCKKDAIVSCSQQCFFDLEHNNLKQRCVDESRTKQFFPESGTLAATLALRSEWCISRQRIWGLFIPSIQCLDCGQCSVNSALLNQYIRHLTNGDESNIWLQMSVEGICCEYCLSFNITKLRHTFDVWFDAGTTNIVLQKILNIHHTNLILEGNDQFKGWYQALLLIEMAYQDRWKVKNIMCHGFMRDISKNKLSKSLNNYESSSEIIDVYGAETLRIYFCLQEYTSDPIYSQQNLKQAQTEYHALRSTLRFIFWVVENTKHCQKCSIDDMTIWERIFYNYFVHESKRIVQEFHSDLGIHKVWRSIKKFLSDFNSLYLDSVKDILFDENIVKTQRTSSIFTLCLMVLTETLKLLSPIISFTSEEFWSYLKEENVVEESSIFLTTLIERELVKPQDDYTDKIVQSIIFSKLSVFINQSPDINRFPISALTILSLIKLLLNKLPFENLLNGHTIWGTLTKDEQNEIHTFVAILIKRKSCDIK